MAAFLRDWRETDERYLCGWVVKSGQTACGKSGFRWGFARGRLGVGSGR